MTSEVVTSACHAIRKGGTVVVTGLADPAKNTIELPGALLTLFEKRVQGSLFGSGDPFQTSRAWWSRTRPVTSNWMS